MDNIPYTYLIGWTDLNKWYYGVRYARNCNPCDFWKTYFTSSKEVLKIRNIYGDPDVQRIHKTFETALDARIYEKKMLKRLKVTQNSKWLNRHNGTSPEPLYGDNNPMRNIEFAKKQALSLKHSVKHPSKTDTFRKEQSQRMLLLADNHPFKKAENRYDIRGDQNPSRRLDLKRQCQHCGKIVSPTNFIRWHGENCKLIKNMP